MSAVTFIAGTDDFLVHRHGQDVWQRLTGGVADDLSHEIIDGQANNADEVEQAVTRAIGAVQTLPMFGGRKLVWLRGVTFLADTVTGRSEATQEQVERLQEVLGRLDATEVATLITACPVDRRRKSYKWFQTQTTHTFIEESKDPTALLGLLEEEAKRGGVELPPESAQALLATIHGEARLAVEEVRKLATYLGPEGGRITPALVAELVPPFGEGDFFEGVEAFFSLDLEWALAAFRRHFFAGHDARPLITSLQNRNRALIQLKALADAGALRGRVSQAALDAARPTYGSGFPAGDKSSLNVFSQNPWYLGRLANNLDRLSLKQLIAFQEAFFEAFTAILDRPDDQEEILRDVALHCLGARA